MCPKSAGDPISINISRGTCRQIKKTGDFDAFTARVRTALGVGLYRLLAGRVIQTNSGYQNRYCMVLFDSF